MVWIVSTQAWVINAQIWALALSAFTMMFIFWAFQKHQAYKAETQIRERFLSLTSTPIPTRAASQRLWHLKLAQRISSARLFHFLTSKSGYFAPKSSYKEGVAGFLESLARSIRSGASIKSGTQETIANLSHILVEASPTLARHLKQFQLRLNSGMLFAEALKAWELDSQQAPEVIKAASSLTFGSSQQLGGRRAEGIEALAEGLRHEIYLEREIYSLSTQARVSGMAIAVLPIAFFLIFSTADLGLLGFMLTTPLGLLCLFLGLGMDILGVLWMKKIISGSV